MNKINFTMQQIQHDLQDLLQNQIEEHNLIHNQQDHEQFHQIE